MSSAETSERTEPQATADVRRVASSDVLGGVPRDNAFYASGLCIGIARRGLREGFLSKEEAAAIRDAGTALYGLLKDHFKDDE